MKIVAPGMRVGTSSPLGGVVWGLPPHMGGHVGTWGGFSPHGVSGVEVHVGTFGFISPRGGAVGTCSPHVCGDHAIFKNLEFSSPVRTCQLSCHRDANQVVSCCCLTVQEATKHASPASTVGIQCPNGGYNREFPLAGRCCCICHVGCT